MTSRLQLRQMIAKQLEGRNYVTGSLTGGTTTIPQASDLSIYPDDHFNKGEFLATTVGGAAAATSRRISDFASSNGAITLTSAITSLATNDTFEIHTHDGWYTTQYNDAIDQAHYALRDLFLIHSIDTSITLQEGRFEYPIPSGIRYISGVFTDDALHGWGMDKYNASQGLFITAATERLAQAFKLSAAGWVGSVKLPLHKVGTISTERTLTVTIMTNTAGLPSGTAVASTATGTAGTDDVYAEPKYITFDLTTPVYLTADTVYHIELKVSGTTDATNYVAWQYDTSTDFPDGDSSKYGSAAWSAYTADTAFLFALHRPQTNNEWTKVLTPSWEVVKQSRYLRITSPTEGQAVRLITQRQANLPTADSSTIEIPESFARTKAVAELMLMQRGAGIKDVQAQMTLAKAWSDKAEIEIAKCRTWPVPNSQPCEGR